MSQGCDTGLAGVYHLPEVKISNIKFLAFGNIFMIVSVLGVSGFAFMLLNEIGRFDSFEKAVIWNGV